MRDDVYCSSNTGLNEGVVIIWFGMNDRELRIDVLRVSLQISAHEDNSALHDGEYGVRTYRKISRAPISDRTNSSTPPLHQTCTAVGYRGPLRLISAMKPLL
jgi:hypothetical protein